MNYILTLLLIIALTDVVMMSLFLVGADLSTLLKHLGVRKNPDKDIHRTLPKVSVIIPAYNEERNIIKCIASVVKSDYPKHMLQIIIVDDGSTDSTSPIVRKYIKRERVKNVTLIRQENMGKAAAINNALANTAGGALIMTLDADSYLDEHAIENAVKYFNDPDVVALASNVKVHPRASIVNLIQRFEYVIGHRKKRAHDFFNIEYVLGGVGSVFRKSILDTIGGFNSDTITEDLDLTFRILKLGNTQNRIVFGSDVISYTEAVGTFADLIKQRYRWRLGKYQSFIKNKSLLFDRSKKVNKALSCFYLPYILFYDGVFLIFPLILAALAYLLFVLGSIRALITGMLTVSIFLSLIVLGEDTLPLSERLKMVVLAPAMYFYMYILSFAEYIALMKVLINFKKIRVVNGTNLSWNHVQRFGFR